MVMDCDTSLLSVSLLLVTACSEFRNSEECTFPKRIFAELCYAGILVVALVETVVRAFFILPGLLVGLACSEEMSNAIYYFTVVGAQYSLAATVVALFALAKNPCTDTLDIRDLIPEALGDWAFENNP